MQKGVKGPDERGAPPGKKVRLKQHLNLAIVSREEFALILKQAGVPVSADFLARIKAPPFMRQGKGSNFEFFDLNSRPPPAPYSNTDSPSVSIGRGFGPPQWISEWYFSLEGEAGAKSVVFAYIPKKASVKQPADKAESAISAAMLAGSVSKG